MIYSFKELVVYLGVWVILWRLTTLLKLARFMNGSGQLNRALLKLIHFLSHFQQDLQLLLQEFMWILGLHVKVWVFADKELDKTIVLRFSLVKVSEEDIFHLSCNSWIGESVKHESKDSLMIVKFEGRLSEYDRIDKVYRLVYHLSNLFIHA